MTDHLPNLGREALMLAEMGFQSIDDLFSDVPEQVRRPDPLPLPDAQTEEEILADAHRILGSNVTLGSRPSFLGAGLYRNHVPAKRSSNSSLGVSSSHPTRRTNQR